jgi:hypothetical protein
MLCVFAKTSRRFEYMCERCRHTAHSKASRILRVCTLRGPGWHLKQLIRNMGFSADSGCECSDHAKRMDEWGADECEVRFEEICGWLQEEARKRGIPYLSVVSRMLVRRAISNARKEAERAKTQT